MICDTIGLKTSRKMLRVLLDSGSMKTLIHKDVVPEGAAVAQLSKSKKCNTLSGSFQVKEMVRLRDMRLPELDKNRCIDEQKALLFEGSCRYDVILGSDFLEKTGIDLLYKKKVIDWFGVTVPMRHANELFQEDYNAMAEAFVVQSDDEQFGEDWQMTVMLALSLTQNMKKWI